MNESLKFSWGHIIAFLALIFISYVTFMGVAYMTDGNFSVSALGTIVVDIVLAFFFLGAQQLKATERKFKKRIVFERILIFVSPIVFVAVMLPFAHFWNVQAKNDEIVEKFNKAINSSKQMFYNYDEYAAARISNYDENINNAIRNRVVNPRLYTSYGFNGWNENIHKDNLLKLLSLQLVSNDYTSLKKEAINWIDNSNDGTSVWNVFLLGNVRQIELAIESWHGHLVAFSRTKFSTESSTDFFDSNSDGLQEVKSNFEELTALYKQDQSLNAKSIIIGFLLYLMLIFPYFLQDRHIKSTYTFWGSTKDRGGLETFVLGDNHVRNIDSTSDDFAYSDSVRKSSGPAKDDNDNYGSFTL